MASQPAIIRHAYHFVLAGGGHDNFICLLILIFRIIFPGHLRVEDEGSKMKQAGVMCMILRVYFLVFLRFSFNWSTSVLLNKKY